ncbi:MAG: type II toxin-antitoxin system VapC family toxin [Lentisphaerae bacterium]|nr:type II toxin-antitoxin system VapC family toxin [Lentisphaerota bacterium]
MIVDTDVLIWASRDNKPAVHALEQNRGFRISVVTYAEIIQGSRDMDEVRKFQKGLRLWASAILHIDESISQHAMFFVERYALGHSVHLADALIAATAIHYGEPLLTGNRKHYAVIPDLALREFRS